jgi:hypothetical protein
MNINKLMNKYNKCMKSVCDNKMCYGCEFDMPDDVLESCGIIERYLEEILIEIKNCEYKYSDNEIEVSNNILALTYISFGGSEYIYNQYFTYQILED